MMKNSIKIIFMSALCFHLSCTKKDSSSEGTTPSTGAEAVKQSEPTEPPKPKKSRKELLTESVLNNKELFIDPVRFFEKMKEIQPHDAHPFKSKWIEKDGFPFAIYFSQSGFEDGMGGTTIMLNTQKLQPHEILIKKLNNELEEAGVKEIYVDYEKEGLLYPLIGQAKVQFLKAKTPLCQSFYDVHDPVKSKGKEFEAFNQARDGVDKSLSFTHSVELYSIKNSQLVKLSLKENSGFPKAQLQFLRFLKKGKYQELDFTKGMVPVEQEGIGDCHKKIDAYILKLEKELK